MFSRIVLLLAVVFSLNINAETKLALGDIPPDFLGKDTNGDSVYLEDHQGKIVVISFWASWCPPCLKELPILENIQNKLGEDKVKVIAINFKEERKKYRKITKLLASLNLTLTHDKKGRIGKKFGVKSIPNLFIVGKNGELVFHKLGYGESTIDEIVEALNQQLSS
jgi:thiol-disulfide isomerase/thioredoxin